MSGQSFEIAEEIISKEHGDESQREDFSSETEELTPRQQGAVTCMAARDNSISRPRRRTQLQQRYTDRYGCKETRVMFALFLNSELVPQRRFSSVKGLHSAVSMHQGRAAQPTAAGKLQTAPQVRVSRKTIT